MKLAPLVLALVACGGSQRPTTGETIGVDAGWGTYAKRRAPEPPPRVSAATRPELDLTGLLPDFGDVLRWPLPAMTHPTYEPAFRIADVFAQPGIPWTELCERGAQNRTTPTKHDEQQYLRGWCHVHAGEPETAVETLAPLVRSSVRGLASAVRADLVNIAAYAIRADKFEKVLTDNGVHDFDLIDAIVATYLEYDKRLEAAVLNRHALFDDVNAPAGVKCRRLVRDMILDRGSDLARRRRELVVLATVTHPDPTCVELFDALRCQEDPASRCKEYLASHQADPKYVSLLRAYHAWPDLGSHELWIDIADAALGAYPLEGAETMARRALQAALETAPDCDIELMASVATALRAFDDPRLSAEQDRCAKTRRLP